LEQSNNKKKVPPTQEGKTQEEIREEKKKEKKNAAQGININVDSNLAKAFNLSEYNQYVKKFSGPIPLIDKYHGKNKKARFARICIAYHCIGKCSASCSQKVSHRRLSASERQRLYEHVSMEGIDKSDNVDPSLAVFGNAFSLGVYRKYTKTFGMKLPQLDGNDSFKGQICLAYHCDGGCRKGCRFKESHRQLFPPEWRRLHDYLFDLHRRIVDEKGFYRTNDEEWDE